MYGFFSKLASLVRLVIPEQCRPKGYLMTLAKKKTGSCVMSGSFAGMRYINNSCGSAYIPKLLGIYERELAVCIEALISMKLSTIIDIGAAEGYYAIGIALRLPKAKIIAFDIDPSAQKSLSEMSKINGVSDRVMIKGVCNTSELNQLLNADRSTAIICDAEGAEVSLLDPVLLPDLALTSILVETHDFLVPDSTETLIRRFNESHHIIHVWQEDRSVNDFPWHTFWTSLLPRTYLEWSVSEWRPVKMSWLWMTPKNQ